MTLPLLDMSASAGSRVVVVTANAWSSEQSYVSVVQTNVDLYRGFIPNLAGFSPNAVMLIASQPGWCWKKRHSLQGMDHSAHSLCIYTVNSVLFFVQFQWTSWPMSPGGRAACLRHG